MTRRIRATFTDDTDSISLTRLGYVIAHLDVHVTRVVIGEIEPYQDRLNDPPRRQRNYTITLPAANAAAVKNHLGISRWWRG